MIKVTLGEVKTQEQKPFPKLATLTNCGGVFLAVSHEEVICIDPGTSGWKVGQKDKYEHYFSYNKNGYFIELNEPITIQNL